MLSDFRLLRLVSIDWSGIWWSCCGGVSHLRRSGDFWARCPGPYGPG